MRKLRVLIFSPDPSLGGGIATSNEGLYRHLSPATQAQLFLVGRRPGVAGKLFRLVVPLLDALRLAYMLLRERHDVYHLNPSLDPRSLWRDGLFMLILRAFRCPSVLVFFRGWNQDYFKRIASSPARRRFFLAAFSHSSQIIVLAADFARNLESLGVPGERIRTSTTMFDESIFMGVERTRRDAGVQIVFLARFVTAKGIYELLEAFRDLSLEIPGLSMTTAGDGEELAAAREWASRWGLADRLLFPGYGTGAEKAQLLIDSDIFALASFHGQTYPNALLEAMAAGLPVVATPVGGIRDVVSDGMNGTLVRCRSSGELGAALRELATDAHARRRIGALNREVAWSSFAASVVTACQGMSGTPLPDECLNANQVLTI